MNSSSIRIRRHRRAIPARTPPHALHRPPRLHRLWVADAHHAQFVRIGHRVGALQP